MKPVIGKAYQISPGWYIALKSAKRAIIIHRHVQQNPDYDEHAPRAQRGPKMTVEFITPAKDFDEYGYNFTTTLQDAINQAAWAPWPEVWAYPQTRGYLTLGEAAETLVFAAALA